MTAVIPTPRACPFCDGAADGPAFPYATRFGGIRFRYVQCGNCAIRYVDPVPPPAVFEAMYATGDYHAEYYDGDGQSAYDETARRLAGQLSTGARVLDYGCGAGHLLTALERVGLKATGAEFGSVAAHNAARRSNCEVLDLTERDWSLGRAWDCIHLGDVVEHLPAPRETVGELLRLLAPNGILSVEGPLEANRSLVNAVVALVGRAKHHRDPTAVGDFPPYHLVFTDAAAQRAFFDRLGTPLRPVHWQVEETGWPYLRNGAVRHVIALAAIGVSRMPLVGRDAGNRFSAMFRVMS